jgi:DNA-binding transcriptional regulator YhcF (GntR family)
VTPELRDADLRVDRGSDVPVGAQLARKLRSLIDGGRLRAGNQLPSLRELAAAAGVNVNTVRSVYARLESEGAVQTEHGRGTFVASPEPVARPALAGEERRRLRREIAALEAELVRRPLPPGGPADVAPTGRATGNLLTTEELQGVRDDLLERLRALDDARADVVQRLHQLEAAGVEADLTRRRSSPSLSGARIRWVGA